jgi:cardiolipin synthase
MAGATTKVGEGARSGTRSEMRQERWLRQLSYTPNMLTMLRLCILPFLVIALLDGSFGVALLLLVLAGISDGLDGLLARWLHQRTVLGQYLDPIADKLMLSTLFVVLTRVGMVPLRVTVLVFGRDAIILVVTSLLFATGTLRDFRPSLLGKANTAVQILTVTVVMMSGLWAVPAMLMARKGLLGATVALTVASGLHYVWLVGKRLRTESPAGRVA